MFVRATCFSYLEFLHFEGLINLQVGKKSCGVQKRRGCAARELCGNRRDNLRKRDKQQMCPFGTGTELRWHESSFLRHVSEKVRTRPSTRTGVPRIGKPTKMESVTVLHAPRAGVVDSGEYNSADARHKSAIRHCTPPPKSSTAYRCYKVRVSTAPRARGRWRAWWSAAPCS